MNFQSKINTVPMLSKLPPIILVPGLGGSKLEARSSRPVSNSEEETDENEHKWKKIWINTGALLNPVSTMELLQLKYDQGKNVICNVKDVEIRTRKFGKVESVDCLNTTAKAYTFVFEYIIHMLEKRLGYEGNYNIFGAPYDFRTVAIRHQMRAYFGLLDSLVVKSYNKHKRGAILISYSMGSCLIRFYLQKKTSAWLKKYIKGWISIAGSFGGSVKALKSILFGDRMGFPILACSKRDLRSMQQTIPSLYFLLPSPDVFGKDYILIANSLEHLRGKHNIGTLPRRKPNNSNYTNGNNGHSHNEERRPLAIENAVDIVSTPNSGPASTLANNVDNREAIRNSPVYHGTSRNDRNNNIRRNMTSYRSENLINTETITRLISMMGHNRALNFSDTSEEHDYTKFFLNASQYQSMMKIFSVYKDGLFRKWVPEVWNKHKIKPIHTNIMCIYSKGKETLAGMAISEADIIMGNTHDYSKFYSDGDGTVNIQSLEACNGIKVGNQHKITINTLHDLDHMQILDSSRVNDLIVKFIENSMAEF